MKFKHLFVVLFSIFLSLTLVSCSDDDTSSPDGKATISVRLIDDPGDFDHVFVEVVDVMVKFQDGDDMDEEADDEGWVSLNAINTGVVDLLDLTGGVDLLLVNNEEVPTGVLSEMRLVLGSNNHIVIDGVEQPLNTPSAQQSGLKVKVDQVLQPNITYTFILDFDVDESIVFAGNSGNINLKPVLRASLEANSGAISGSIEPADVQTEITATKDNVVFLSTFADANGNFVLAGVEPGIYEVTVTPDPASEFEPIVITDVEVTLENTTELGTIELDPDA